MCSRGSQFQARGELEEREESEETLPVCIWPDLSIPGCAWRRPQTIGVLHYAMAQEHGHFLLPLQPLIGPANKNCGTSLDHPVQLL